MKGQESSPAPVYDRTFLADGNPAIGHARIRCIDKGPLLPLAASEHQSVQAGLVDDVHHLITAGGSELNSYPFRPHPDAQLPYACQANPMLCTRLPRQTTVRRP